MAAKLYSDILTLFTNFSQLRTIYVWPNRRVILSARRWQQRLGRTAIQEPDSKSLASLSFSLIASKITHF